MLCLTVSGLAAQTQVSASVSMSLDSFYPHKQRLYRKRHWLSIAITSLYHSAALHICTTSCCLDDLNRSSKRWWSGTPAPAPHPFKCPTTNVHSSHLSRSRKKDDSQNYKDHFEPFSSLFEPGLSAAWTRTLGFGQPCLCLRVNRMQLLQDWSKSSVPKGELITSAYHC